MSWAAGWWVQRRSVADMTLADGPVAAFNVNGHDLAVMVGLDPVTDALVDLVTQAGRLLSVDPVAWRVSIEGWTPSVASPSCVPSGASLYRIESSSLRRMPKVEGRGTHL